MCQSTKHSHEHAWRSTRLCQSLGLLGSAKGPDPVCQSLPFLVLKQRSFPRSPGWSGTGERWTLQGRGGVPTSPQSSTHVPCSIPGLFRAGKNQAQNVSEGEGEGRNKSRFLVDVFPRPSPDQLLQLSSAQPPLRLLHTSGAPRGAARDPPPAEHTGVGWSDWESLRVKGWLAQRGCWSMWCGTGTPAALLPRAERGAHVQVMVATHIPRHCAELSLPPRMLGRCDSR